MVHVICSAVVGPNSGSITARDTTPIFTRAHSPRGDVYGIDQALELGYMPSPPLVGVPYSHTIEWGQGFRFLTPPAPVAVKRVDGAAHVEPRSNQSCTGRTVLLFEIKVGDCHK